MYHLTTSNSICTKTSQNWDKDAKAHSGNHIQAKNKPKIGKLKTAFSCLFQSRRKRRMVRIVNGQIVNDSELQSTNAQQTSISMQPIDGMPVQNAPQPIMQQNMPTVPHIELFGYKFTLMHAMILSFVVSFIFGFKGMLIMFALYGYIIYKSRSGEMGMMQVYPLIY